MSSRLAARWSGFGTSIFTEVTDLARSLGAVNLAQGFPDFDGPEFVKDAAAKAMQAGQNQYARMFGLPVLALPGSQLELLRYEGTPFVREGFADRRYRSDGSLVPRSEPDAMITDVAEAVAQAKRLVAERGVQSLCVHGDNPAAVEFVRELRRALEEDGCNLRSFGGTV